ncbi:uncharacterized protein TNCV_3982471 [Trichonephila clavipes]|nr:uncharacterized protein TNCV_3982471 [Trichonephila clavipes]
MQLLCENPLNGDALRDHDHLTGAYRGAAQNRCNLNFKLANYIPVVIHNLRNYDGHFLIQGIDANNLYGCAMSQHLPTHFSWTDEDVNFMNVPDDSEIGYIFEVDLEYPDELHDLHNCYPLAPEKIEEDETDQAIEEPDEIMHINRDSESKYDKSDRHETFELNCNFQMLPKELYQEN